MTEDAETHAASEHPDADAPEHREEPQAPSRPKARERGRMRRRLRKQSRIREALLLDLGATVWELHRHGRREPELLQAKAAQLAAVDREVRGLAEALDGGHGIAALVDAEALGICADCSSLLSPGSRFCHACGTEASMNGTPAEPEREPPSGELDAQPEPEALTEILKAPLPRPPGVSPHPAGAPSLRRKMGRRLRGSPPE